MPRFNVTAAVDAERTGRELNAYDIINVVRRAVVRASRSNDEGEAYFDEALSQFQRGGYARLVEYSRSWCYVALPVEWLRAIGDRLPPPTREG